MTSFKKAYLYNRDEYTKCVTPLLKEFEIFIKRNQMYFIKSEYYGLVYLTYSEFKAKPSIFSKYKSIFDDNFFSSNWSAKNNGIKPIDVTDEIKAVYDEYQRKFVELFGDDINKIDKDDLKSNKRSVRRAINDNTYVDMLMYGEISFTEINDIFSSNGIKIPANIMKMKYKVDNGYKVKSRELTAFRTKEFVTKIKTVLRPLLDEIKEKEKYRIEYTVKGYLESEHKDMFSYIRSNSIDEKILYKFVNNKEKINQYDLVLSNYLTTFVDEYINDFAYKVNVKLSELNINSEYPELDIEVSSFSNGKFTGCIIVKYDNGFTFKISADVIYAGGYNIQCGHLRYIFNINYNGKSISNDKLEDAYKMF